MNNNLKQRIEQIRLRAARAIAPPALYKPEPIKDTLHISGLIRAREVPFENRNEWAYWWLPERNGAGTIIRPARMSAREKERYTAAACENILVSSGITQVLAYIGSATGNATGFAQYLALGNIGVVTIESNDTSVSGEFFRGAVSMSAISGVQQDISMFAGTTQANGVITNAGLFGNGASATIGSGTLMTHSLFSYTKTSANPVTFDYLLAYQ